MNNVNDTIKEILNTAPPFFTPPTVERFLMSIKNYLPLGTCFFQMTQKRKIPTLEFVAIAFRSIVEIETTRKELFTNTILLTSISEISTKDSKDISQLEICLNSGIKITYTAYNQEKKAELLNFARAFQRKISK